MYNYNNEKKCLIVFALSGKLNKINFINLQQKKWVRNSFL